MKYYILSAIVFENFKQRALLNFYFWGPLVFVCGFCCFRWGGGGVGGNHALLSSELTSIIQGIPLTDAVSLCARCKATRLDHGRVSRSASIIYYLCPTCAR